MRGNELVLSLLNMVMISMLSHRVAAFRMLGKVYSISPPMRPTSTLAAQRGPADGIPLDGFLLSENPDLVSEHLRSRRAGQDLLDEVSKVSALRIERSRLIGEGDQARNTRKTLSKQIGMLMKEGKDPSELKKQVDEANGVSAAADDSLADIDNKINTILSFIPNLLDDRVPDGADESANEVVYSWGDDLRKLGETFLWHDEIARNLRGLDLEAAARISGARFSVLVGPIARLERALQQYFLDFHVSRSYTEVSVPYIVGKSALEGTGQLPKFYEDLMQVNHEVAGEEGFLIPTAEVPVTNLFRGQLLNSTDLPIHLVCLSPSFRAEAGSYGRDTRGLLRQHQFHKCELVKVCTPETAEQEHQQLTLDAEELLKSLQLPYRKLMLCSGDIGFSARLCYDLEVWLPGQQMYKEISSCSNCHDFQSRRMGLRYRPAPIATPAASASASASKKESSVQSKGKKNQKQQSRPVYPFTMNGSGLAIGRALAAVLENYQQEDGSVVVPEVLRPYMGGIERLEVQQGTGSVVGDMYSK